MEIGHVISDRVRVDQLSNVVALFVQLYTIQFQGVCTKLNEGGSVRVVKEGGVT